MRVTSRLSTIKRVRALGLALGVVSLLGCNSSTGTRNERLRVVAAAKVVTMENPNDVAVFYFLVNPDFLALLDFALCTDPMSTCPRVAARDVAHVPYDDIAGYQDGEKTATLLEWRLERRPAGDYEPVNLQTTTIQLR